MLDEALLFNQISSNDEARGKEYYETMDPTDVDSFTPTDTIARMQLREQKIYRKNIQLRDLGIAYDYGF